MGQKRKDTEPQHLETSKVLLLCVLAICFIFLAVIVGAWVAFDRTDAGTIAAIFAFPITAAIIWYYNKAKAENLLKIRQSILEDTKDRMTEEDYSEMVNSNTREFIAGIDQQIVQLHNDSSNNE